MDKQGETGETLETIATEWTDDVLHRKPYADFLTTFLQARVIGDAKADSLRSFTLALDAPWGLGKTFFIRHWADDLQRLSPPHTVIVFNAWEADYASDPVLAFMGALKDALGREIASAGLATKLRHEAEGSLKAGLSGMRKALYPAGKQVAKGVIRKLTGIGIDEVIDAIDSVSPSDPVIDRVESIGLEELNKGLDTFFAKALEQPAERAALIAQFRDSIGQTLRSLTQSGRRSLPMFVFVDELDRCRPDFAIGLLEGLKHIFGVPGICFVVAVNLEQLSEAVKAVYGGGFNGYGYLKRFFDFEYSLPPIDGTGFAQLLLREANALPRERLSLGLPHQGLVDQPKEAFVVLSWVFEAFALDLRAQRQVFEMLCAAATGVSQTNKIFLLWIAVLCSIRHKSPSEFDTLASSASTNTAAFDRIFGSLAPGEGSRCFINSGEFRGREKPRDPKNVSLQSVAAQYFIAAGKDLKQIQESRNTANVYDYPEGVLDALVEEMPRQYYPHKPYVPSIRGYYQLVRTAGLLGSVELPSAAS